MNKVVNISIMIICLILMLFCIWSVLSIGSDSWYENYTSNDLIGIIRSCFIGVIAGMVFFSELLYLNLLSLQKKENEELEVN